MASEAALSSANSDHANIAQRMAHKPVNLDKVTSAVGRGPNLNEDHESGGRLEDIGRPQHNQREIGKASDATRST